MGSSRRWRYGDFGRDGGHGQRTGSSGEENGNSGGSRAQCAHRGADTTIDLPEATLLPGLIDAHTHLTFELSSLGYQGLGISTAREALRGAKNARRTLEAGFTTVRNVGARDYADIALRDAINDGDVIGPRMVASGPALGITGGHCDENLLPPAFHFQGDGVADGIEAVQHKVREVIKYGADVIKICATGGVLSKGDDPNASQYTLEEMKAIVADAHRLGRRVAAHAHGEEGVRWASEAGVDSIEHGNLMDDAAIATLKKRCEGGLWHGRGRVSAWDECRGISRLRETGNDSSRCDPDSYS